MDTFPKRVDSCMKELNIGLRGLARHLDVSHTLVRFWLAGKRRPADEEMDKMSEIFRCDRILLEFGVFPEKTPTEDKKLKLNSRVPLLVAKGIENFLQRRGKAFN